MYNLNPDTKDKKMAKYESEQICCRSATRANAVYATTHSQKSLNSAEIFGEIADYAVEGCSSNHGGGSLAIATDAEMMM